MHGQTSFMNSEKVNNVTSILKRRKYFKAVVVVAKLVKSHDFQKIIIVSGCQRVSKIYKIEFDFAISTIFFK